MGRQPKPNSEAQLSRYRGMSSFFVLWSGQSLTMVGTGMVRFVFIFYTFQTTGSATQVTLVALFSFLPKMILSPLAGAMVDRWGDRKGECCSFG